MTGFLKYFPLLASIAFAPSVDAGALEYKAIESVPIGKAMQLSGLSPRPAAVVCVLQPYQDRLFSKETFAVKANIYLAEQNYVTGEGHFAFVFIGAETIDISTFKRSKQLDILAKHEITSGRQDLPEGFVPQDCVSWDFAALARISMRDRIYVVLGEVR